MLKASLLLLLLVLPTTAVTSKASHTPLSCLAANIYFEARNQSQLGQLAVKDVTLNRGKNVCKTVFAVKQFSWTHQQSWPVIESFLLDKPTFNSTVEAKAWQKAKAVAESKKVVLGPEFKHYHTVTVSPKWTAPGLVIGSHKFIPNLRQKGLPR
jgi:spore germination cell wall hydrolase CwlJ-like protein